MPPELPPFASPLPTEATFTGVGISSAGCLYLYGDDPKQPGEYIPAVTGRPVQLAIRMLGANGRYGARPFLELFLEGDQPEGNCVLRIPAARPTAEGFVPSGAARSLLPALAALPEQTDMISVTSKRGNEATFLNVFPRDADGKTLPQVRVRPVAAELDALNDAIAGACARMRFQTTNLLSLLQS